MNMLKLAAFLEITLMPLVRVQGDDDTPLTTDNPNAVALYQACVKDDLSEVKNLVGSGAPLDGQVGKYGFTPLIGAADKAHLDVLQYLIDYRAKLDFPDKQGSTPLLHACWTEHIDCALALIDAGANVNLGSKFGRTPLMYAAMKGNDRIVEDLIEHKVNLDANCNQGPALQWAAANNQLSTVKLLVTAGANPNLLLVGGGGSPTYSVLGCAAANNNLEMIDCLLGLKTDVNSRGTDGSTPLMAAANYGRSEAIERLLDNGANIDLKDKSGRTALMIACVAKQADCIRTLLNRRGDVNIADSQGETALTIAGDNGEADIVELLKNKGAQRTDVHIIAKAEPEQPLSPAHAWALSVGVIYTQRDRANPKILGGGDTAENCKTMLERDWKILDKESLLNELDELREKGHHSLYQDEGAKLVQMSDDQFNQYLSDHPDKATAIKAMRASYLKWKDRSGLAWDICRSGNLVNAGFATHYLDEQEAWDLLMALARQAQSSFSSWQEMSDNFLDGREIWAGTRDPGFEACAQLLLNPKDPNSPWNQNPWKTDLSAN